MVRLNEVMADNRAAVPQGEAFPDWIELHNPGPAPVNLTNWSLTDNSDPRRYLFPPGTTIPAGGYLVVWCDANTSAPGRHTGFALSRTGETVRLFDAATNHADALTFGRQVPDLSVGRVGAAWELTQPTPGAANRAAPLASPTDLAFNEWLAAPEPGGEDWIELFNRSQTAPVRLEGLYLGTHAALDRLGVPAFLPPGGYLQLLADEAAGVDHLQFKLPASGGDLVLYDETGREIERVGYAEQSRGISAGRFPDGTATIQSFAGSVSPGAPNYRLDDQPLPNVVISEIMYDPAPDPAGLAEVAHREFLELHNLSTNSVPLFDPSHPNNTWRLAGGITFQVPTGTTMPPGGWLVVVAFDPLEDPAALAGFRAAYGAQAVVTGPWSGRLANEGETIELLRPDTPLSGDPPDAELVPYVLVERVTYSNQAPWPTAASGTGASLQRIPPDRSGNDPGHWVAAPASPGWSGNSSESDTDGDGLPDGWERQHGTDPAVADAGEDPDDDGLSNLEEFLAGTDPQSAASVLVLRVVEVSATGVMLDFAATAGRHYTALRCADLESGEWVPFAQVPAAGTGGLVTVTDTLSPGSGARFYQILSTR